MPLGDSRGRARNEVEGERRDAGHCASAQQDAGRPDRAAVSSRSWAPSKDLVVGVMMVRADSDGAHASGKRLKKFSRAQALYIERSRSEVVRTR